MSPLSLLRPAPHKIIQFQIFNTPEIKAHGGNEVWYDELLEENKLFFTIDFVKDLLDQAYNSHDEVEMCVRLEEIIDICKATENSHFIWSARLLYRHLRGIYTFAKYGISTGKFEGINNKIKTERRKGYEYPNDEYNVAITEGFLSLSIIYTIFYTEPF